MNRTSPRGIVCRVAMLLGLALGGCETSEDSSATGEISGSWLYSNTDGAQSTWALVQSEDGTVDGAGTDGATINGSVNADSIDLSLSYASTNLTVSLNGTVSGSTMSGSFTNSIFGSGSWTAVQTK